MTTHLLWGPCPSPSVGSLQERRRHLQEGNEKLDAFLRLQLALALSLSVMVAGLIRELGSTSLGHVMQPWSSETTVLRWPKLLFLFFSYSRRKMHCFSLWVQFNTLKMNTGAQSSGIVFEQDS